jgi:hypothetical protein
MDCSLTAEHLAGVKNVLADKLSRVVLNDDIKINPSVLK